MKIFKIFSKTYVIELVDTIKKKRVGFNRRIMILLISIQMIFIFTLGELFYCLIVERSQKKSQFSSSWSVNHIVLV